jgi:hypothetical protein
MEDARTLSPFSATLFGELAQIYYQWHEIEKAREYFVFQSRLFQMEGNLQAAVDEIEKSICLMQTAAPTLVREEVLAQQVSIFLATDLLAEAQTALKNYGFAFEDGFVHPKLDDNVPIRHPEGLLFDSALRIVLYRSKVFRESHSCPSLRSLPHLSPLSTFSDRSAGYSLYPGLA